MNSIDELKGMGIAESTAVWMLERYKKHIGEIHGCIKVTDITYIGNGNRDIELTCTLCGAVYHRTFKNSKSKWSEIRSTCPCQEIKSKAAEKKPVVRNDYEGYLHRVYGDYEVIGFLSVPHARKSGSTIMWRVRCVHCGVEKTMLPCVVRNGKRCMCQIEAERMEKDLSEIGKKYERLTVVGIEHKKSGKYKKAYAICNCDCGGHVTAQLSNVKLGFTKSCGCLQEEFIASAKKGRSEARSRSPLYVTWKGMKDRCLNEKNRSYANYGGRGIRICDEWLGPEGFDRFEKWSCENGYKPDAGLSLDRIDVNGNYEPGNCRYATVYVQAVNQRPPKRRPVKTYTIGEETKTFNQWCRQYCISTVAVNYRMKTLGMDLETALKTPKTRKGNVFAGEQSRDGAKQHIIDMNKCQSYIEANLYLAAERHGISLVPQYPVGRYHADFCVDGTRILIECDGYDAHKSKEQVSSDCARERFFMKNGYMVVRFSGAEINKDPDKCCEEISEIIEVYHATWKTNSRQKRTDAEAAS